MGGVRRRLESSDPPAQSRESPWSRDGRSGRGFDATGASGRDLMALADQEVNMQDETLDFLSGTVANLKNMGGGISTEIDLHCELLGEMEGQTDGQVSRIKQQSAKLGLLNEQS